MAQMHVLKAKHGKNQQLWTHKWNTKHWCLY